MGIHKKSPPDEPVEKVTWGFRKLVREMLKANAAHNEFHKHEKGDLDYRPANHADLADAIKGIKAKGDKKQLSDIIGPAKIELDDLTEEQRAALVDESYLVGRIRKAMGIKEPTTETIDVPRDRMVAVRQLLELRESDFTAIAGMISKRSV